MAVSQVQETAITFYIENTAPANTEAPGMPMEGGESYSIVS